MDSEVCAEVRADLSYVTSVIHHLTLTQTHVCNMMPPSHYVRTTSLFILYSAAWDCVLVCPTHDALEAID